MSKKRPSMNKRAALLFVIFSVLFFTLTYRFFVIQLTGQAEEKVLAAYAEEKYSKERTLEATRGSILDRNGNPLATDAIAYKLIAILSPTVTPEGAEVPNHVVNPSETARLLSQYIPMEEPSIYERLTKEGAFQVEFGEAGRNISYEVKSEIDSLKLPGIAFIRETKRSYPNGIFASHLLGFANYMKVSEDSDEEKLVGQMGIESLLNSHLEGHNGKINYQSDLWGYILPTAETQVKSPEDGKNVYLTLDKKIQTFLEDAMSDVVESYKPKAIMAVVADAKTGEILGMSQRPTFDPNTREGINDNWQNIIVETAFEPGSTMKVFTLAAAIEEGVFNPNAEYQSGFYNVPGGPIRDHNYSGWGKISFLEGIQRSSNVAIAYLLEGIGEDRFLEYLYDFKFGSPTNFGLANEASGKIQYQWPIEKVSTAFGQASSVSALQLIQAMTAITNDGNMMRPYVIDKIVDAEGNTVEDHKPNVLGSPISKETAHQVLDILETVVSSESGTGRRFAIEGYQVAGKTGTAQIYDPSIGNYLDGKGQFIYSFIGAAPADDPELIMYVMVQQPKLNEEEYESGSVPVSKVFNTVMKNSLHYLNIEPDELTDESNSNYLADLTGKTLDAAKKELEKTNLAPIIVGKGKQVVATYPSGETQLINNEKVIIVTDGKIYMPEITNWSLQDVMKLVSATSMELSFEGTGFVVNQSIKPGTPLAKDSKLKIQLETPVKIYEATKVEVTEGEEEQLVDESSSP